LIELMHAVWPAKKIIELVCSGTLAEAAQDYTLELNRASSELSLTALLPRIVKKELSTQSALAIWCSRSSDTHNKPVTWEYAFRSSRPYDIYAGQSHRSSSRVQVAER
jgi:hypothetical protein